MKCKFIEKTLIFSIFLVLVCLPGMAQEWIQNIKNPNMPLVIQFSGSSLSSSDAQNYSDEIEMQKTTGKLVVPIQKSEDLKQSLSLDFNQIQIEQINKDPASPIPDKLTEIKFGHQFIKQKNETEYFGMNTQIGSSSDEPFFNWSVTEVSLTPFYYYEENPNSSWVWMLNYSNQRSFLPHIPLPGFIYVYNNRDGFSLYAGIPVFGFAYSITPKLLVSYFGLMPWIHDLKMTYFVSKGFSVYTELKAAPELFKLVDARENEDRIILQDQKAILGTQIPLTDDLSLDVHGGYSFNRKIYQAKRPLSSEDWQEEIANQTFFNTQLLVKF